MKLSLLSNYRTHIMGAAMMWIMWFHSAYTGTDEVSKILHRIGFYGVDMFLMVSGLGLYFSMRKSKSIGEFYKKRAVRILPAYLIVTIGWYAFYKTDVSFVDKLLSILGINYFRGTVSNRPEYFDWFLPTLFVLYLLTPLYDKLFQKASVKWKFTLLASMISPILCIIGFYTGRQVLFGTFARIPIFLIGYWMGWFLYEKKEEEKAGWMVHLPLLFVGIILAYYIHTYVKDPTIFWGLNCYPALFVAPSLSVILGFLFEKAEKYLKIVGKILLFPFYVCGRYSLEIYLIHQRLMEILNGEALTAFRNQMFSQFHTDGYYFLLAVVSIALAAALHELIALVTRLLKKIGKKPKDLNKQPDAAEPAAQV